MQGHFGEYMTILQGDFLAPFIKGYLKEHMAVLPCDFFAIFIQVCFGGNMSTYSDAKYYIYWLPGKVFSSLMQGHLESISQNCKMMFWQCLCNIPQRGYGNIAI